MVSLVAIAVIVDEVKSNPIAHSCIVCKETEMLSIECTKQKNSFTAIPATLRTDRTVECWSVGIPSPTKFWPTTAQNGPGFHYLFSLYDTFETNSLQTFSDHHTLNLTVLKKFLQPYGEDNWQALAAEIENSR